VSNDTRQEVDFIHLDKKSSLDEIRCNSEIQTFLHFILHRYKALGIGTMRCLRHRDQLSETRPRELQYPVLYEDPGWKRQNEGRRTGESLQLYQNL